MKVIGITGGSGVGKTIVANILKEQGAYIIDADIVAKEMIYKGSSYLNDIVNLFGADILDENKNLNRKVLANIVYNDSNKKASLDELTYKHVLPKIENIIEGNSDKKIIAMDVVLLVESGLYKICDTVVSVISSRNNRIRRICKRDKISSDVAESRINAQQKDEFYISNADIVIYNNGNEDDLGKEVLEKINI